MNHSKTFVLLLTFALAGCGGERIEKTHAEIVADPIPTKAAQRRANYTTNGFATTPATPVVTPLRAEGDLKGYYATFEEMERVCDPDFFLQLLETPSMSHSVWYVGERDGFQFAKVVLAAKASVELKDLVADKDDQEATPAPEKTPTIGQPQMVRIIKARATSLEQARLEAAKAVNLTLHAKGAFATTGGLPSTAEAAFLQQFDDD